MRRLLLGFMFGACAATCVADGVSTNGVPPIGVSSNGVATSGVATNSAPVTGVSTNGALAKKGAATTGVRNPFWPMGYEGEREVISSNVRQQPKAAAKAHVVLTPAQKAAQEAVVAAEKAEAEKAAKEKAAKEAAARAEAERKKREITDGHWEAAKAALTFGGRVKFREDDVYKTSSIVINGKVYADDDLVSFTHDSRRYTWRVEGLSDKNMLKLVRVRAKYIEKPGAAGKKSDKGVNP